MVQAAKSVRQALDAFYAGLSNAQNAPSGHVLGPQWHRLHTGTARLRTASNTFPGNNPACLSHARSTETASVFNKSSPSELAALWPRAERRSGRAETHLPRPTRSEWG